MSFQFTPLREGRRRSRSLPVYLDVFQFTPLREGRLFVIIWVGAWCIFQFTPLREGRHDKKRRDAVVLIFQFTPLREGRHFAEMVQKPFCYFNSRPSARGDGSAMTRIGAGLWDFNSRPSARGDARESSALRRTKHFNSRPSARGDLSVTSGVGIPPFISIHAPPRGATNPPPPRAAVPLFQFTPLREGRPSAPAARLSAGDFNSRPSARGDRPR